MEDNKKTQPDFFEERDLFGQIQPKIIIPDYVIADYENNLEIENKKQLDVRFANLTLRIIAYFIDTLIISFPLYIIQEIFFIENRSVDALSFKIFIVNLLVWTLYYGTFESSSLQATLGKYILGLKVIDENSNRLSFKKACLRYLATFISIIPFGIGIWTIASDEKKQGWHDKLTGCYVINNRKKAFLENEVIIPKSITPKQDLENLYLNYTDVMLIEIINKKDDYQPDAVEVAKNELNKRNIKY
jgi:uncharacterized RDD family membrane protein YckC